MPPASRRSGTAHTSKASGRRSDAVPEEASSSSMMIDEDIPSSQHLPEEMKGEDIHQLLERFEKNSEPLTRDTSDTTLRALRNDWSGMEANFVIAYQLISDVAERLADARAAEGLIEESEDLQELDLGMRGMIDLHQDLNNRKTALEEIRAAVGQGEVRDAAGMYQSRTTQLGDSYDEKTVRQKYIQSEVYRKYKSAVWGALRDEDMPPLADLLPHDGQDNSDDDEIVAYGGDKQKYKCPISLRIMEEPLKSTVCIHAFEKQSILEFLGNQTKACPSGCGKSMNKNSLKEDQAFTNACRKYARREQMRKETQRTQVHATDLD